MKRVLKLVLLLVLLLLAGGVGYLMAKLGVGSRVETVNLPEAERLFAERMQNVSMVGSFTIAGRENQTPREDHYDIASVDKVGDDQWRFNATIGENGITLPIVVTMKFVGDTPMITITDFSIPSMGTFTARVFFYGDRYAGTWEHAGRGGGYMLGRIVKK
jgi:hypothetical protein